MADFLALMYVMYSSVLVTDPYGILGQVWYLIARPSAVVRPVRIWSDHFFAQNGFSRTTFLAKYVFAGAFSHVSF